MATEATGRPTWTPMLQYRHTAPVLAVSPTTPSAPGQQAGAPRQPGTFHSIALGGASCVITVNFTHPIETVKTRMQVSGEGVMATVGSLLRNEGATALWKGIQPAWGRESLYASIKIGGYGPIRDAIGANAPDASFALKFAAGATAGGIGSVMGNPFDVLKTLMQANTKTGAEAVGMTTLARRLLADQGVRGFYRGVGTNCARAWVLSGSQMATYDVAKGHVVDATGWKRKDPRTVFVSSVIAGFLMTFTVAPFDMVRTQLMNQPTDRKVYKNALDAVVKIARTQGPLAFYRGFLPIWGRFAPSATLQMMIFEYLLRVSGFQAI